MDTGDPDAPGQSYMNPASEADAVGAMGAEAMAAMDDVVVGYVTSQVAGPLVSGVATAVGAAGASSTTPSATMVVGNALRSGPMMAPAAQAPSVTLMGTATGGSVGVGTPAAAPMATGMSQSGAGFSMAGGVSKGTAAVSFVGGGATVIINTLGAKKEPQQ